MRRHAPWALTLMLATSAALATVPASAQDGEAAHMEEEDDGPPSRPTSGDLSLFSGRTNGNGETAIAAGVGWPGIWAGIWISPSSTFNLGIVGHVYYGSPIMGFSTGAGGGLTIPIRLHLFGKDKLDIALYIEPGVVLGEGSIVGAGVTFGSAFGYGVYGIAGALAAAKLSDAVTLNLGVMGEGGFVHTPDRNIDAFSGIGAILVSAGVEALMSRDTMLFVQLRGGVGFSGANFEDQGVFQGSIGLAYLL